MLLLFGEGALGFFRGVFLVEALVDRRDAHVEQYFAVFERERGVMEGAGFLCGKRSFADWALPHLNNSNVIVLE